MRFKLIAALFGLMVALPSVAFAQNADDQSPYEDSKPSPNIPMQGSNDSGYDQDSTSSAPMNSGSMDSGSMDSGASDQTYNTPAPEEKNGVARVSLIHGDVSTQRGDNGNWSAAALNAPVLAGDRVSTGDKARTELQLDYANMLRLSADSQANINTLTHSQIQVQFGHGMANYTVLKNSDADAEIDTPNVAIRTGRRESSFRILVTADDHTEVLVRRGEVEVTTPQGGTRVTQGQFITIQGTGDQAQYKIGEAPARDDWDQWNTDRDNVIRNAASRQRTNDYYVGAEDLDGHGTWSEVPDYGPVWRPTVSDPDWAPYRDGRWVYEPYWGWTWVSYDSWGWAPYHYGRWMYVDGGWGWWPGPVYGYPYYRPIWAPAYVSFFGFGGGFGGGFGFGGGWGSIGWLPLGPCDRFRPWYGRWGGRFGDRNFRDFNRGGFSPLHGGNRFSNVNLALNDRHFRGATSVSGNEFGRGRMNARPMNHAQFQNARFSTGRLPVNPSRESYSASGRPAASSTTRNASQNQRFFSARGGNSASNPRLFERRQSPASNTNRQDGRLSGNGRDSRPGNGNSNMSSNNESRRFNQPGQNNVSGSRSAGMPNNSQSRPEARGNSTMRESGNGNGGGWQRFSPMPSRSSSDSARSPRGGQNDSAGRPSQGGQGYSLGRPSQDRPSQDRMEGRGSYGSPRSSSPQGQGRGYSSDSRGYGGSRPPLNMRQPIVTPRSYGGGPYGRGSYGGGDRGGYSGGGRPSSAPSYGRPSAPSYGGGGGRSAPSYGGGGHSAPSGGPSHGGGGSSHGGGGSSHGGGAPSHGGGGGKHGR